MNTAIFEKHKTAYVKHALQFQQVFGCRLQKYHSVLFGFDILQFEKDFDLDRAESEGKSIADVLTERYGEAVCTMIKELL